MKVSGLVIQERNIKEHTESIFNATYKGKKINITKYHGFGKPKYEHLTRYMIDVVDMKTGLKDVDTYEDFHEIKDAIRYALQGAMLL